MDRLDKILAHLGFGTRKEVKQLVRAGRVAVNGLTATDPGQPVNPAQDQVAVDGQVQGYCAEIYLLLNKPAGVITATTDPRTRTVLDLVPDEHRRKGLHPVGRLDKDTEGLLILTTDGELGHRLTSPKWHVEKEYYALLDEPVGPEDVQAFASGGLQLDKGVYALPSRLAPEPEQGLHPHTGQRHAAARVTVMEGKYHQVKRMFAARDRRVLYLKRLRMGPVVLDRDLPPGAVRPLAEAEVAALYQACGLPVP